MAELWFSVLTRALLRRGEFTSRADLIDKITGFAIRCNRTAQPWIWSYDARADHARYRARHGGDRRTVFRPGPPAGRVTAMTTTKANPSRASARLH